VDVGHTKLLDASNIDFSVAVGPLSAEVTNGSLDIHKTGSPTDHMFSADLSDGHHDLTSITTSDVTVALNAGANISLPVKILGVDFPPPLVLKVDDLASFFTNGTSAVTLVSAPDFASKLNINFTDDLSGIVDGFDQLL